MPGQWTVARVALLLALGGLACGAEEAKTPSTGSDLDVRLYGRIKGDASYDTANVDKGNYVKWVVQEGHDDHEFHLTADETRIGVNIRGPDAGSAKTSGKLEMDFYGRVTDPDTDFQINPLLRHAYLMLEWPEWSLLAGQTWDIVSPLSPRTLNYSTLWWAGNVGYLRPQIRLTRQLTLCEDTALMFEGGVSRTMGKDIIQPMSGEEFRIPAAQGRVALTVPSLAGRKATLGISGLYGKEEFSGEEVPSWSVNLDLLMPLTSNATLKAECFSGETLDAFLGGIGQGINAAILDGIRSQGGWAAVEVEAGQSWSFTGGGGIEDPRHEDLPAGGRDQNLCVFGNAIYSLTKSAKVGLELSQWRTQYVGMRAADDTRVQFSVIYEF